MMTLVWRLRNQVDEPVGGPETKRGNGNSLKVRRLKLKIYDSAFHSILRKLFALAETSSLKFSTA